MILNRYLMVALLAALPTHSRAQEIGPIEGFVMLEGAATLLSWVASQDPQAYGAVSAVGFFVVNQNRNEMTAFDWTVFASIETLSIYNIGLDKDEHGESEIFRNNMIGWQLVFGVAALAEWLTSDDGKKGAHLDFVPTGQGLELRVGYRF